MKITHTHNVKITKDDTSLFGLGLLTIAIVVVLAYATLFVKEAKAESYVNFSIMHDELFFGEKFEEYFNSKINPYYGVGLEATTIYEWVAMQENNYLYQMTGNPLTCAYHDVTLANGTKLYSIGYGSVAKREDECITKEEAWIRFRFIFNDVLRNNRQDFHEWDTVQIESFSSLVFNVKTHWSEKVRAKFKSGDYVEGIYIWEALFMKGTVFEAGLKPRRCVEVDLFTSYKA